MQILPIPLSSNEKTLVKEIMQKMIESTTRLGDEGHEVFEEFLQHEIEMTKLDIDVTVVENIILYEEIDHQPEDLHKLSDYECLNAKFILLKFISPEKYPAAQKRLIEKLDNLFRLKAMPNEN